MSILYQSIGKIGENTINEDSVKSSSNLIAVSDGAGGGGLYADKWSSYLLSNLPEKQFGSFDELDGWIGGIWETFYKDCEVEAKKVGGLLLDKFYDEGSFATLVSVYQSTETNYKWMAYGDSVAFCFDRKTKELHHSFTNLCDFSKPPYLISLISELDRQGFRKGEFEADDAIVFCASDTLSHYILMMYYCSDKENNKSLIAEAVEKDSKNSNFINTALNMEYDFEKDILNPLVDSLESEETFRNYISKLKLQNLIGVDDYSLVVMRK